MNITPAKDIFYSKKDFFDEGNTRSYEFRIEQLILLKNTIKKYEKEISEALYIDLNKSEFEAYASEIGFVYQELNYAIKNLRKWMKPKRVLDVIATMPSKTYLVAEPLGVVLIIGPWNYPFHLIFAPLIGAIAAGNCAIVKPSNKTKRTAIIVEKIIEEIYPAEYISVVQGPGSAIGPELIDNYRFNHIFFTGSQEVGKDVMRRAAQHLTPVTLELGGKSPVIVHKDANLNLAAKRIVSGRYYNAGQTCIAPDYLLVHEDVKEELVEDLIEHIKGLYGENAQASKDYGRIVNKNRFDILANYLENARIIYGGNHDADDLYIEPTIIETANIDDPVMQEEIFGPLIPVITYREIDQVVSIIRASGYPLALYLFTNDKKLVEYIINTVEFGGGCINNTLLHLLNHRMPFGGVGASGIGGYHGKYSFATFSNYKGILESHNKIDVPLRYPPYSSKKFSVVKKIMK
jgi:aldehyde dehydrogenase (NAD+)